MGVIDHYCVNRLNSQKRTIGSAMPKFLTELTAQDWIKLGGIAVAGTLLYADVHSSIQKQQEADARQEEKIVKIEKTIAEALTRQGIANEKITDALREINGSLKAIEANSGQLDKRVERIERKL